MGGCRDWPRVKPKCLRSRSCSFDLLGFLFSRGVLLYQSQKICNCLNQNKPFRHFIFVSANHIHRTNIALSLSLSHHPISLQIPDNAIADGTALRVWNPAAFRSQRGEGKVYVNGKAKLAAARDFPSRARSLRGHRRPCVVCEERVLAG